MDTEEISGQTYEIFTKEEADERGISYRHWSRVEEVGEWALTDDDYVSEVRFIYPAGNSRQVVLSAGRAWDNDHSDINYEEYKEAGNTSYNRPQKHMEREVNRPRGKRAIDFYARQLLEGVTPGNMPWDIIGKIFRPGTKNAHISAKRLFRTQEAISAVNKRIMEILDDQGLSETELAASYKELLDIAKGTEDLTNWRLTLDSLTKMRGIDQPSRDQNLLEESVSFSREISDGIQSERQKIEASRTQESDSETQEVEEAEEE